MSSIAVNDDDPTPPYEQIRRQLAQLIATGTLRPGDRLAPLRQLAGDLNLAVGTVARAYRELEAAGLIEQRRGGGTRVARNAPRLDSAEALRRLAEEYVAAARALGTPDEQIRAAVEGSLG
ncbi:MAG: GntR family transcriptional regulator [Nocardioides sp.]|jgi:DNA-binding transcriptional regulator YhcF (GntR family)